MTTAHAPEIAMPILRLSRRASDQSEQRAWPATGCVARNSATSSSKDSPAVAASVWPTSRHGFSSGVFSFDESGPGTRQKCRARTEAIKMSFMHSGPCVFQR